MKKLQLCFLTFFIFSSLYAIEDLSFSVKGGLNLSNAQLSLDGSYRANMKLGVNLGAYGEYMLNDNMGIQSGLVFSTKGTIFKKAENIKTSINLNTLQMPIHFLYKFEIEDELKIALHGGAYIAYILSGSYTEDMTGEGEVRTRDIYGKRSPYNFGRFDLGGFGFGIQFEYENFLLDIGYDLGILDLIKDTKTSKGMLKTKNIYVSAGYRF